MTAIGRNSAQDFPILLDCGVFGCVITLSKIFGINYSITGSNLL